MLLWSSLLNAFSIFSNSKLFSRLQSKTCMFLQIKNKKQRILINGILNSSTSARGMNIGTNSTTSIIRVTNLKSIDVCFRRVHIFYDYYE